MLKLNRKTKFAEYLQVQRTKLLDSRTYQKRKKFYHILIKRD